VTSPGNAFNLTEGALSKAQQELDQHAQAVLQTFKNLEEAVMSNPSKGDAFTAAQNVASQLTQQANNFNKYASQLAENIGLSAKNYQSNNDSGAQSVSSVAGNLPTGATFSRLNPGS
jgi:uncharacterized protein YukE